MERNCFSLFTVVDLHVPDNNINPLSVDKQTQKIGSLCTGVEQQNTFYCCQKNEHNAVNNETYFCQQ